MHYQFPNLEMWVLFQFLLLLHSRKPYMMTHI